MRDLGIETLGGPSRQVSDSIALGPGLVLQGTRIHFRRNEEVFGEGENAEYVYRVVSGAVRTIRFSSDGRRQILNFYLPGDVFGLECGKQHTLSAEAVADCDLSLVRRSLIDTAAQQDAEARGANGGVAAAEWRESER